MPKAQPKPFQATTNLKQMPISKKLQIWSVKKDWKCNSAFFQLGLLSTFLYCHYCWIHRWWPSPAHAVVKCQLWDLQLLALVELGDSCSSVFSKGQGVIISHLRRQSQRVQGKESVLSETVIYPSLIQEKRGKTKDSTPEVKASLNKVRSWLELRCDCGDLPTNQPRAKVSWGGEFLLPKVSYQKRTLCFGSATHSSTLTSWNFPAVSFSKLCCVVKMCCIGADNRKAGEGWSPRTLLCKHITGAISIKGESLPDCQAWGLFLVACSFSKTHKNTGCPSSPGGVQVCPLQNWQFFCAGLSVSKLR